MLMSATTKEEKQDIYRRFDGMISGKGKEIKLCYVTVRNIPLDYVTSLCPSGGVLTCTFQPERLAKDKGFVSKMQRLYEAKKLSTLHASAPPAMEY